MQTEYFYTITTRVASFNKKALWLDRQQRAQQTVDVLATLPPNLDYQFIVKEIEEVPREKEME